MKKTDDTKVNEKVMERKGAGCKAEANENSWLFPNHLQPHLEQCVCMCV